MHVVRNVIPELKCFCSFTFKIPKYFNIFDRRVGLVCMPFTIFQKAVHRIPTLALYKSLLKLSSSLEVDLASRIKNKVRREFRKNGIWSPRIVKYNLIRAFKVHPLIASTHESCTEQSKEQLKVIVSLYTLYSNHFPRPKNLLPNQFSLRLSSHPDRLPIMTDKTSTKPPESVTESTPSHK